MNPAKKQHPKDTEAGAIAWGRPTCYVIGDRVRKTVLFVTPDLLIEMTPEYAEELAQELRFHCVDVLESPHNGSD